MTLISKPIKKDYVKSKIGAHKYFSHREPYAKKYFREIIRFGKIDFKTKMADVACGSGNLSCRIAKVAKPRVIYMVDINNLMLEETRTHCHGNFVFIQGKASEIDKLIGEKLDIVLCTNAFESYVGNQTTFLTKCFRLLKDNGKLIFDISTRGMYHDYTIKFQNEWRNQIIKDVKQVFPSFNASKIRKGFKLFDKKDSKLLLSQMRDIGFKVLIRKYRESWSVKQESHRYEVVPSRTDLWLGGISFAKRKEILRNSIKKVIKKVGLKPLVKYRLFFIARKCPTNK